MKKLLIIDDEFIFRQGLRYMMDWEACGYCIEGEASNGQEGLKIAGDIRPDLILCDVVMPVMDGVEFVRQIKARMDVPVIMLSNYDEFDKVRQAFQYGASDYLLKNRVTRETLLQCFEHIYRKAGEPDGSRKSKSFGSLIRQIFDGYVAEPYTEFCRYMKNRLPGGPYLLVYIDNPKPDFENEEKLQETFQSLLPGHDICTAFTSLNHAVVLIGMIGVPHDPSFPSRLLGQLTGRVRHGSLVLSLPFSDFSGLKERGERLAELSKYSILFDQKLCFLESELLQPSSQAPSPFSDAPFPDAVYEDCIALGRYQEAGQILLEYLGGFLGRTDLHPYSFKKFVEHSFYEALKAAKKQTKELPALSRIELKLFKQMDQAVQFHQITEAVTKAYDALAKLIPLAKGDSADPVIDAFYTFLEQNYRYPITLYDAAKHIHMNYSYLSAYISQNTQKHFSEHLNDTRIRHAARLLKTTDESISAISLAIGYADQSYFGKIFKKLMGVTPHQYRNAFHGRGSRNP